MKYKGPKVYDDPDFSKSYLAKRKKEDNPNDTLEKPIIKALMGDVKDRAVLDLGCGDGQFGVELLEAAAAFYHGIDGSERMVELAKEKLKNDKGKIEKAKLEEMIFPRNEFNVVISRLVLHYIENLDALFLSIFQSLKPGGAFIFSVEHPIITSSYEAYNNGKQNRNTWIVDQYFESGERENFWIGKQVIKYHKTLEEYFNICKNAGFTIEAIRESKPERANFKLERNYQRRKGIPLFLFFKLVK